VESKIHRGEYVQGWMFGEKIGHRQFKAPPETIAFLTGVKATVEKPATPAEMERRGVPPEKINLLTFRPRIGRQLIEATPETFGRIFKEHGQKPTG
jgi:hypothetical protein